MRDTWVVFCKGLRSSCDLHGVALKCWSVSQHTDLLGTSEGGNREYMQKKKRIEGIYISDVDIDTMMFQYIESILVFI